MCIKDNWVLEKKKKKKNPLAPFALAKIGLGPDDAE
jgi:hypothetical protein